MLPEEISTPASRGLRDSSLQSTTDEEKTPAHIESSEMLGISTTEFYCFSIPKGLRYSPNNPFAFSWSKTVVYAAAVTLITANLYYCQPILIEISKSFQVSHEAVTRIPTCLQAGYATGLFIICPLGDVVRRRQLTLTLIIITTFLTVGLAVARNIVVFEILSFLVGLANVAGQILIPLVAETAPLEKRAFAFSILLTGLMLGILLARVLAGIIGQFVMWRSVYYTAIGLQSLLFAALYFTLPDHPAKNDSVPLQKIYWTMGVLAVTEPIAVQALVINLGASASFACYWVTLTFLLDGSPYHYSTLEIGLFGLIGMAGVAAGPLSGRIVDRILPWHSMLISAILLLCFQAVQTAAGGVHISAVVISCFGLDFFQQIQSVAIATYMFSLSMAAISRLNALYMITFYVGQIIGTAVGTKIFLQYGWRASAGFVMALYAMQLAIILLRGPHCSRRTWFGYKGGVGVQSSDKPPSLGG